MEERGVCSANCMLAINSVSGIFMCVSVLRVQCKGMACVRMMGKGLHSSCTEFGKGLCLRTGVELSRLALGGGGVPGSLPMASLWGVCVDDIQLRGKAPLHMPRGTLIYHSSANVSCIS